MKKRLPFFILLTISQLCLFSQNLPPTFDTIFVASFESGSINEPVDLPPGEPAGNDETWVNFSENGYPQFCLDSVETVGWYPLFDFTDPTNLNENIAFTSCSYTSGDQPPLCTKPTKNWLILPPVEITGDLASIEWKSASYYGPYWLDGYKVLVSTTDNFPASFTDTVFVAAEMINAVPQNKFGSLDPKYYKFSTGYVHANIFTDTVYFLETPDPFGFPNLLGQFEPHAADLSKFKGKKIYIAFLHDSHCDAHLQIDDIVVVDNKTIATSELPGLGFWSVSPNPARDFSNLKIEISRPVAAQVFLQDVSGKILKTWDLGNLPTGETNVKLDLAGLPAGLFFCNLKTDAGSFSTRVLKL